MAAMPVLEGWNRLFRRREHLIERGGTQPRNAGYAAGRDYPYGYGPCLDRELYLGPLAKSPHGSIAWQFCRVCNPGRREKRSSCQLFGVCNPSRRILTVLTYWSWANFATLAPYKLAFGCLPRICKAFIVVGARKKDAEWITYSIKLSAILIWT